MDTPEPIKRPLTVEQLRDLTPSQIEQLRSEGEVEVGTCVPGTTLLAPAATLEIKG
jgi:hypothetical protein